MSRIMDEDRLQPVWGSVVNCISGDIDDRKSERIDRSAACAPILEWLRDQERKMVGNSIDLESLLADEPDLQGL